MFTIGDVDPGAALAALLGPIAAVGITLWLQARERGRTRKETLLRQMLATRMNPADPTFNIAISLIPVEFADRSDVRTAHRDFMASANRNDPADTHKRQEDLIVAMMRALGYDTERARDAVREPYHSVGLGNAIKLQQEAMQALPRLATALEGIAASSAGTYEIIRTAAAQGAAPAPVKPPKPPEG